MADRLTFHNRHRHRAAEVSAASFFVTVVLAAAAPSAFAQASPPGAQADACAGDNGGITLSPGFCASVFADNLGHVRHMVVGARRRRSTSTPGAATITATTSRRPAAFWWR